jgi:hypothetical protein
VPEDILAVAERDYASTGESATFIASGISRKLIPAGESPSHTSPCIGKFKKGAITAIADRQHLLMTHDPPEMKKLDSPRSRARNRAFFSSAKLANSKLKSS